MRQRSTPRLGLALLLGSALAAAGALALADPPRGGFAPDPAGNASKKQWIFEITYRGGKASITRVGSAMLERPTTTARVMGRFAIELWVGKELLDRVRFDVPLLDDDPNMHRKGPLSGPRFTNVSTRIKARMVDHPRATYMVLLDRSTGEAQRFWWPPEPDGRLLPMNGPAVAQASDAGPVEGGTGAGDGGPRDAGRD
ncbi:hypothetical protein [Polyangium aurulentum]|uniref:hypothetical protein n=1 Tax=Polyangium aurulentum TaxID=2567896 RepID=UPI0010ADB40B|nr:hypothetical protein [Polyangium aurulentum]UQA61552.1 hypothetical protein E8A73_014205 [Polyangium aurulentum]